MRRQRRIELTGNAYCIVQRGNERQPCFFNDINYRRNLQTCVIVACSIIANCMPGC